MQDQKPPLTDQSLGELERPQCVRRIGEGHAVHPNPAFVVLMPAAPKQELTLPRPCRVLSHACEAAVEARETG